VFGATTLNFYLLPNRTAVRVGDGDPCGHLFDALNFGLPLTSSNSDSFGQNRAGSGADVVACTVAVITNRYQCLLLATAKTVWGKKVCERFGKVTPDAAAPRR
jgi:hypothetical protein